MESVELLRETRPRGLPIVRQTWRDNVFLHWSFAPSSIEPLLPSELELDTFDGRAWISIIPFHLARVRPAFMPPLPIVGRSKEINVRTYVRVDGVPGVWFFSLDSTSWAAITLARTVFHLPYFPAQISYRRNQEWIALEGVRRRGARRRLAISARVSIGDPIGRAEPGSLDEFLVERYAMYSMASDGLKRGRIRHDPWELSRAEVLFYRSNLLEPLGLEASTPALVHYSAEQKTWFYPLEDTDTGILRRSRLSLTT